MPSATAPRTSSATRPPSRPSSPGARSSTARASAAWPRSPCSARSTAADRERLAARGARRRAGVAAAAHRPHHPARRRRRRRRTPTTIRHRRRSARDEPHAQRRPHAADQQADLHLDPAHHPRRRLRPHPGDLRDPRELRRPRPVLRRRRAGAALVLPHRRHPGAHADVPVLAGDERHPARVLPRHAADRRADRPRSSPGDRRRRRPHRERHGRLGDERLVLRLPWIWESGPVGALLFNFVVAMLFFVVGFWAATIYKRWGTLASRSCSSASARCSWVRCGWSGDWTPGGRVFDWFAAQGVARPVAVGAVLVSPCSPRSAFLTLRRAVP